MIPLTIVMDAILLQIIMAAISLTKSMAVISLPRTIKQLYLLMSQCWSPRSQRKYVLKIAAICLSLSYPILYYHLLCPLNLVDAAFQNDHVVHEMKSFICTGEHFRVYFNFCYFCSCSLSPFDDHVVTSI